ncbi:MAG: PhzF family phenazine biosynthesis protein [Acidimicrobiia bacterium]|nr:PhzF family phenazine biosynthesis protein [Acidimicrobiia bacterium]
MSLDSTSGTERRGHRSAEITDQSKCGVAQLTRRSWLNLAAAALPAVSTALAARQVRRPAVVNGHRYLQNDVFTDKPLTGNQLAVFTDMAGLSAAEMQAMTRETRFFECTFVQPPGSHRHGRAAERLWSQQRNAVCRLCQRPARLLSREVRADRRRKAQRLMNPGPQNAQICWMLLSRSSERAVPAVALDRFW